MPISLHTAPPVTQVRRGLSALLVPRGLWHRQLPQPVVKLMLVTGETAVSAAEAPRHNG